MYIPPWFTAITCEPVDEASLQSWAKDNNGVWHPVKDGNYFHPARAKWAFGPLQKMEAALGVLTEEDKVEWAPLMHTPPQSLVEVQLSESLYAGSEQCAFVLRSLFAQWDSYAFDMGAHEWVSALLRDVLPTEQIIQYKPPPPGPPTPWIWVNGKYTKNEAYYDNLDAAAAAHENQL